MGYYPAVIISNLQLHTIWMGFTQSTCWVEEASSLLSSQKGHALFIKFKNKQNKYLELEVGRVATCVEWGKDWKTGPVDSGNPGTALFLHLVLVAQVCLLCEMSSSYILMVCALFCIYLVLRLKSYKKWSSHTFCNNLSSTVTPHEQFGSYLPNVSVPIQ